MWFNKKFNRYESDNDNHYVPVESKGTNYTGSNPYAGKIKCSLVHQSGNSIIIPHYIFLRNGWIQPLNFTAPLLVKLDDELTVCDFFVDIQNGESIRVRFYNNKLIRSYSDKSQLFECEIYGPPDIEEYACGEYKITGNNLYLKLFHHTNEAGYTGITRSKTIRSSRWNYRGSKECINYHFVYFTHIPEIKFPGDLITVAMSADGKIEYKVDSVDIPKFLSDDVRKNYENFIYTANVYRSTTKDRQYAISFFVSVEFIDVKHVYKHYQNEFVFYEICFPYTHRIKVKPNNVICFNDENIIEFSDSIVTSDYSIIGDARIKAGLAAPYEEEETEFISKIEDCGSETFLDFWFNHGNKDLFSVKKIDKLNLKDIDNNPTK